MAARFAWSDKVLRYWRQALKRLRDVLSRKGILLLSGACILALAGALLLWSATQKHVQLELDGETIEISTHAHTVASLLRREGIALGPHDLVFPAAEHTISDGDTVRIHTSTRVEILLDGETVVVDTPLRAPADIIAAAGAQLFPGDRVWVNGIPWPDASSPVSGLPRRIRVRQAMPITLTIDGAARTLRSAAPTLGEALWENGIQVFEGDRLEPSAETALEGPLHASLRRGREIQIEADGALIKPRVVASTVGEALAQAGVGLLGLDYAQPGVESALPDDGQVKVIRVVEQVIVEQKPLAFETLYQPDAELEIDNTHLITAGSYGVLVSRVRIRTEDGVEKDRLVEGEWQAHAPEPRVIGYGTKIVIRTLDTPSGPVEYWRAVDMFVTSYSPCRLGPGVDRCGYHTAIGYKVEKGIAAVILSWFRYMRETQVYIPGYGSAIIADTGGGIPGRYWIDVAYSDDDYVPWARWRTIYFLTPVPANIMYILD